ncbi:pks5 [Symbiodinium pilosum]|uniref:Pks5 protein n=1 Tax=Symbiodinium pilosum TaxID=2952 RepID=A0A812K0I5_SYMPI|nr:pks5 [Symbiodinium pilosum]
MPSSSRRPMTKDQLLRRLQDHAASKGGLCLADCYLNSKTKVQWECEHGHRWHAAPINVLYGKTWCPQCAVERRMGSLERLRDHARQRGGRLLSTKYTNSQAKYRWQCKLGHTWEAAAYSVLNKRTWCPECARKQKVFIRRSLQDLQEHAASRGGRCLATKYCGVRMKVQWECTKGHRWPATPTAVLYQNSWCPVCAQRAPIGLERLRDHAAQRGGECLATEYVNNCSKENWASTPPGPRRLAWWEVPGEVVQEQIYQPPLGVPGGTPMEGDGSEVIVGKTWCPTCATSIWRTEAEIRDIFETIFCPSKFGPCNPKFLEGLQLDGYCAKLSLAFEYQGEQHYDSDSYFHFGDISSFEAQQERDTRKRELCKAAGVRLVIIPYFADDKRTFVVTVLLQWFPIEDIMPVALPPCVCSGIACTEAGLEVHMVILRADQMHHRHQSSRGEFSIISWILAAEHSTTRGWTGGLSRTLGVAIPTARELIEWSQERIKDLVEMEDTEKFQTEVPREWQLMMRHSFFRNNHNPVAVRGEAGHMPTTNSNRVLWEVMNQGADFVTDVPYMRWDHDVYYDEDPNCWMQSNCFRPWYITKTSIKHGQFIEGVDLFDNKFFGVSNMEAQGMDPMQRHILETSYEDMGGVSG